MMSEERFWEIVEGSRRRATRKKRRPIDDFIEAHIEALAEELRRLTPCEIVAFDERFWHYHRLGYR